MGGNHPSLALAAAAGCLALVGILILYLNGGGSSTASLGPRGGSHHRKAGASSTQRTAPKGILREFVYPPEGALTESAHGTSLVTSHSGGIVAAWFGGFQEGAPDVSIWSATRNGKTGRWGIPQMIAKAAQEAHWNPVLFWGPSKEQGGSEDDPPLWLHYKVGDHIPHWRTFFAQSPDGGDTWGEGKKARPRELVPGDKSGGRGCVKNKPLILEDDGTILAGGSHEAGEWRAFVDQSRDGGRSWTRTDYIRTEGKDAGVGLIQPTLWRSGGDHVHMLMRSDAGWIFRSDSQDRGRSWTPAYRTKLPNNNSGLDVVLVGELLVLAYNPVHADWGPRYPLRLALSTDNGATWPRAYDVETEPGEYSYPAVIPWRGGEGGEPEGIHMTYTWNRERVRYFSASLPDLEAAAGPMPPEKAATSGGGGEGEGEGEGEAYWEAGGDDAAV